MEKFKNGKHHPSCFNSTASYVEWLKAARMCGVHASHGFCSDCLPEYKRDMLAAGRCDHPDTVFRVDKDGFTEGRRVKWNG